MVYCVCEEWKKGMKCINGAVVLARHHGWDYEGESMVFCPWCGKRLKKDGSEKTLRRGLKKDVKSMTKRKMGRRRA